MMSALFLFGICDFNWLCYAGVERREVLCWAGSKKKSSIAARGVMMKEKC